MSKKLKKITLKDAMIDCLEKKIKAVKNSIVENQQTYATFIQSFGVHATLSSQIERLNRKHKVLLVYKRVLRKLETLNDDEKFTAQKNKINKYLDLVFVQYQEAFVTNNNIFVNDTINKKDLRFAWFYSNFSAQIIATLEISKIFNHIVDNLEKQPCLNQKKLL